MNVVQGSGSLHTVLLKIEEFVQSHDNASLLACTSKVRLGGDLSLSGPYPCVARRDRVENADCTDRNIT